MKFQINDKIKKTIIVLLSLSLFLSFIGSITLYLEIGSFILSLVCLFISLTRKPIVSGDVVLTVYSCLVSLYFCLTQEAPGVALLPGFISVVLFIGLIEDRFQKEWFLVPTGSILILTFFGIPDYQPILNYFLLYVLFFSSIRFLSQILPAKVSITILNVTLFMFALIVSYYSKIRFGLITISDLKAISTFIEVAENYSFKVTNDFRGYGIIFVLVELIFLIPKYKTPIRKISFIILYLLAMAVSLLCIGIKGYVTWNSEDPNLYGYDSIPLSIIQEVELHTSDVDFSSQKERLSSNPTDTENLDVNIVCVLCESYADVKNALEIRAERDPLQKFHALNMPNIKKGYVRLGVFGGGTSSSEWEVLTGLSLSRLPRGLTPMISYMDKNYAFTADPMYEQYEKSIIHPFHSYGWNRDTVYKKLGYDNQTFIENWGEVGNKDKFRGFISDSQMYQKVIEQLNSSDKPQFIHALTVQNHGGYDDKNPLENSITVEDPVISKADSFNELETEDKEKLSYNLSTYFTCVEHSTNDLIDFLDYLDAHSEEKTLVVFYGDHWPGKLSIKYQDACMETPYLVYSNFGPVDDMPEHLDLSLLYPFAKKAAGLPLTSWEKYLVSLNGEPADKDMTEARILNGYF